MALINYGAGEITDRLTILALKLLHYGAAGKPTDYLRTEQVALLAQCRTKDVNGAWLEEALDLAAVNGALWTATDQLRALAPDAGRGGERDRVDLMRAGELGIRILELNDRRATLVEAINKRTGEFRGSEKG